MNAKTEALKTNENNKFVNDANGNVAVNGVNSGGMGVPPHDNVAVTYPTNTQEVYVFTLNAATVATITIDYTDGSKNNISNVARS